MGTRPCRHCGSGKHWDSECRHSRKGEKLARVNCIQLKDNNLRAQEDYDNLFYELESDSEEGSDQQDFCRPLQCSDLPNQPSKPKLESLEEMSSLEGTEGINLALGAENTQPLDSNSLDTNSFKVDLTLEPSFSSRDLSTTPKIPLNQNTRSVSLPFLDKDGHEFKLRILNSSAKSTHRKNQRFKRKTKFWEHDRNIPSAIKIVIPPETPVAVPILANFPSGSNCL